MINKIVATLLLLMVFCFTVVLPSEKVQAELVSQTYESQSGIGFYGEYEFPNQEKPSLVPNKEKLIGEVSVGSPDTMDMSVGNRKLPQTGMKNINQISIGIFLIIMMGLIVLKNKKKKGD